MPFNETVLLKGGPLGGELRVVPYPALKLLVPVIAPVRVTEERTIRGVPHTHYLMEQATDEYRYHGRYLDGKRVLEWVRPDMSKLREENRQLRHEVEDLTRRLDVALNGPPPRRGLVRMIDGDLR